jgi:hypothetical protein
MVFQTAHRPPRPLLRRIVKAASSATESMGTLWPLVRGRYGDAVQILDADGNPVVPYRAPPTGVVPVGTASTTTGPVKPATDAPCPGNPLPQGLDMDIPGPVSTGASDLAGPWGQWRTSPKPRNQ